MFLELFLESKSLATRVATVRFVCIGRVRCQDVESELIVGCKLVWAMRASDAWFENLQVHFLDVFVEGTFT